MAEMNFIVGVLGFVFVVSDLQDARRLSLDLETKATEAIATNLHQQFGWPEFNLKEQKGATVSVLGFLYDPLEYKQKRVGQIHRDLTLGVLRGKSVDEIEAPPFPTKIKEHNGVVTYIRVLPVFIYGETRMLLNAFNQRIDTDFVIMVIRQNLELQDTTEILSFKNIVGYNEIEQWTRDTVRMLEEIRQEPRRQFDE